MMFTEVLMKDLARMSINVRNSMYRVIVEKRFEHSYDQVTVGKQISKKIASDGSCSHPSVLSYRWL